MVGISLALQLDAVLPPGISLLLVESIPVPAPEAGGRPDYHPSFDARSTALSYSSRLIYENIGVWGEINAWSCGIESIHVSSRGHFGSTLMHARDYDWPALGYVVENAWMGNALIQALHSRERVQVCSPAKVSSVEVGEKGVALGLEGDLGKFSGTLQTDLLLVADGVNSVLRDQLGVVTSEKPYGQHALVANIAFDQPHAGCAYERFTDEGPLALLPLLPTTAQEHRSGLVWTLPPDRAGHLHECSEDEFLSRLQERFGYRLGRMRQVGTRHEYPLSLVRSEEQVRQGVVVMGNAAHAVHPVAGQGFNLALRDVAELGRVLAEGLREGRSPGDLAVLQRYQQRQLPDQERTISFSDRVPALFMHTDPALGLGRDLALAGLDILPGLKREFVRYAAGLGGEAVSRTGGQTRGS